MKHRVLRWVFAYVIAIVVLIGVSGCSSQSYPERPAMWEVTDPGGGGVVYLFGSIHAAEEGLYPLEQDILDVFSSCDYLAVEVDMLPYVENPLKSMELAPYMMYLDGGSITDDIDTDLVAQIQDLLEAEEVEIGVPKEMSVMLRPYTFISLLSNLAVEKAELSAEQGVDLYFLRLAREQEKDVLEVEDIFFQLELFDNFSPAVNTYLLQDALQIEAAGEGIRLLYDAWKVGDLDTLVALTDSSEEGADSEELQAQEEYNQALITERNTIMSDVAEDYLLEGKRVFYVVGALHMVGGDGIVQQLTDRGYQVKRV